MLRTLIRKQYLECFRSYFVNAKTGKARSKLGIAGMFVFFAAVMLMLAGIFVGMSLLMGDLLYTDFPWLYYALSGVVAILLGTFGSVFNTFSVLYLSKDNELLLAMPIPPSTILSARMTLVYGLSLMYSAIAWIPAIVYSWIVWAPSALAVVFQILLIPMIALFVTVLTCILGWLVAAISVRLKNRSILIVLASLVFIAGYYYVCMHMTELFMSILANAEAIGSGIRIWANLLYQLGLAAQGSISSMLLFCGITLAMFAASFAVLSRSFLHIVMRTPATEKKAAKVTVRSAGVSAALLRREWNRFLSSPTYMLNCGLGIVMTLVMDGMVLYKRQMVLSYLDTIFLAMPMLRDYVPLMVALGVGMACAMNTVSTPSISLEGKHLWILRSLPVSGRQVLWAKLSLHLLLNLPAAVISAAILGLCLKLNAESILLGAFYAAALNWTMGAFGLVIGVLRPNFNWTSETMPIKQSINVLLSMLLGWLLPIATAAACYFLRGFLSVREVLTAACILLAFAAAWLTRWLSNAGAARFDAL